MSARPYGGREPVRNLAAAVDPQKVAGIFGPPPVHGSFWDSSSLGNASGRPIRNRSNRVPGAAFLARKSIGAYIAVAMGATAL